MISNTKVINIIPNTRISAVNVASDLIEYDDSNYVNDDVRMAYDGIFGYDLTTPITRIKSMVLNTRIA